MVCTRLGSISVTSLIQTPGKQHTALESVSGWHMGASAPLRRELSATITHRLFLVTSVTVKYRKDTHLWNIKPIGAQKTLVQHSYNAHVLKEFRKKSGMIVLYR